MKRKQPQVNILDMNKCCTYLKMLLSGEECALSDWENWTVCKRCGQGERTRRRDYINKRARGQCEVNNLFFKNIFLLKHCDSRI